ncbi:MAG: NADH-quinone oxidoreductase subunit L [Candidatus Asgardarchaeia archaeon]
MLPYAYILVWVIPLIDALLMPIASKIKYGREIFSSTAAILSFIFAFSMLFDIPPEPEFIDISWVPSLNLSLVIMIDGVSVFVANIVSFISALVVIYSKDYMAHEEGLTRYYFFINLFIGAMLGLVMAGNLLQMFIFWEVVGLCSYSLIGFWNKLDKNVHAGTKAFIVTRAGDVALLGAILIIYYYAGTFDINTLMHSTDWLVALASVGLLVIVPILAFIGAAGKSAQVPLQVWLPEAMAGPTTVSALIHAATMVNAGVFLIARFVPLFFEASALGYTQIETFFTVVALIGALTAFIAGTMGTVQTELKKVLAYSTVSQLGYMMLGLGVSGLLAVGVSSFYSSAEAVAEFYASIFHLGSHALFKALLFLGSGAVLHAVESGDMRDMGGLKDKMPLTWAVMVIGVLSLTGIPPFAGFFSKDRVLEGAYELSLHSTVGAIIYWLGVLAVAFTAFYSFRMIGLTFHGKPSEHVLKLEEEGHHVHDPPVFMKWPLIILAAGTIIFGFFGPSIEGILVGEHVPIIEYLTESFLNPLLVIGFTFIALGLVPGYVYYIAGKEIPEPLLKISYPFKYLFENRWFINAFYYKVFVYGLLAFSKSLFKYFEVAVLDNFNYALGKVAIITSRGARFFDEKIIDGIVNGIAYVSIAVAGQLRKIQTGDIQEYLYVLTAGIILLLAFVLYYIHTFVYPLLG